MTRKQDVHRTSNSFVPKELDCKYLWHLISAENENIFFGKLLTFLQSGLWCARLDTFNDPLEGALPIPNVGLLRMALSEKQSEMAGTIYKKAVLRSFASCWHISNNMPSLYAWCAFGGKGNGIAIRIKRQDMAKFVKSLNYAQNTCCYLGRVSYVDHGLDEIKDGNVIEPAFCVQKKYQRENEARLLIHTSSLPPKRVNLKGPFGRLFKKEKGNIVSTDDGNRGFAGGHANGNAVVASLPKEKFTICVGDGVSLSTRNRIIDLCKHYEFPMRRIFCLPPNSHCKKMKYVFAPLRNGKNVVA